ncbi:MAG TPA: DUF1015 domain-containing protein [Thermosulfurimonas dismutans]|uniref:DUF1015 domain-containing protein n=1 Tax=Thermosulfurimonas dismutans TaxID=999894 RepID=A0A7C3CJJ4_9BACT|nr:DUF1015 domain-containing protein [Thermosulfurimonas dismutans]
MPEVRPFYGWRYHPGRVDLSRVVAPPYDVVTPEEAQEYLRRDPYNIFHLELGGGPERYRQAARSLQQWIKEGILIREDSPSIYLYRLHFSVAGKEYTRTGFIALVRLSPFTQGKILPHEKTFPRVTEDRLELLRATSAQFSQIFVLYRDPELFTLQSRPEEKILEIQTEGGQRHELYRLRDPEVQRALCSFWQERPFYIADGHHRYTTALRYAQEMESRLRPEGPRCFHYMMMYMCPFEDPGLLVLPTHRILRRVPEESRLREILTELGEMREVSFTASLPSEEGAFLLFFQRRAYKVRLHREILERWERESGLPENRLPASWCARIVLRLFGETEKDLKEKGLLTYTPWPEEVRHEADKGALAFLLPPTPAKVLEEVARSGKVMPHKSTYFYPKILTGLVIFRINPEASPPCP